MVQKTVPVWYNRSCLRFGIYSENLDDELLNRPRFQNKRLRYCVGAGMVLVTTLLVGLMIYNMFNGYGLPSREKDALQHLLMLRMNATAPTPLNKTTIASTFATTTNTISSSYTPTPGVTETTTDVTESTLLTTSLPNDTLNSNITFLDSALMEVNFVNLSANTSGALPYRYVRKDIKIGNRRHGKQRSSRPYDNVAVNNKSHILPVTFKENNPQEVSNNYKYPIYWVPPEVALQSEIQSRIMNQAPRPFKVQNVSVERPANNRIKMVDSDNIPFYEFGSVNKYPQLAAYRYPNEAKNIQDIIKYLTAEEDSSRSPSNKQHNTQVFRAPSGNNRKIKFAGVYKTAEKENSLQSYNDPEESMNEFTLSDHHTQMHDSSLNAHAYAADPFQAFKPSDPSEINLLANSDFRFSPINNRVRITSSRPNGHRWKYYEANPNDKYFPRPPINFRIPPSSVQSNNQQPVVQVYPGTYTTATFKPFGKDPVISSSPTSSKNPKKVKPFSVMLDIYPMMDDTAPQATVHKARPHPRPGHGLGHVRFPPTEQVKRPDQVADNKMT
ncbi:hypothetical protein C0J52_16105 [Blattella germanica]|nr:hypothetical protein C0J52_16105 [Blattella germanica]